MEAGADCSERARGGRGIGEGINCTCGPHARAHGEAELMMVTRIRPSPVAARLGCSTEAALSTSWVSRIGKRLGQVGIELQCSSGTGTRGEH